MADDQRHVLVWIVRLGNASHLGDIICHAMRKRVARDLADQCTYVVGLLNELPVRPLNVHQR